MPFDLEKFKNKLIVFEGPDHCGKSTIAKMLKELLRENGMNAEFVYQPGDYAYGPHAGFLDELCTGKKYNLDPLSNLFAFLLDRSEHTAKVIEPDRQQGKTVISDRWWYSTIAYQFYGKRLLEKYKLNLEFAQWMNKVASHYLEPDVVFYFERAQDRVESTENDMHDLFESESDAFKRRVREAYHEMAQTNSLFKTIQVDENPHITLGRVLECQF
jgi:dTMP kinase